MEWRNRITLKSREFMDGDARSVEIGPPRTRPSAIPPTAPTPRSMGAVTKARSSFRRARASSSPSPRRMASRRRCTAARSPTSRWSGPSTRLGRPPGTRAADFRSRRPTILTASPTGCRSTAAEAGGLRLAVLGEQWADLSLSDDLALDGEALQRAVEYLRGLVPAGEVTIEAKYLRFETGQGFLDYVADIKAEFVRDDVEP